MRHSLKALLAVIVVAAFPVSATAVTLGTSASATTAPGVAQSGQTAKAATSSSQAQADVAARKVAKAAAKQAKKCAKWARKAASAHTDRKREKFTARYNASCVTAAKATTKTPAAPLSSTSSDALVGSDAITGVIGPSGVPGSTSMGTGVSTGSGGSNGPTGNSTVSSPVASQAVGFAAELVTTQVPEPGTLALLGLGLVGLGLSRRRKAN